MSLFLKNCWYAAAFSDEVTREPMSRTLLETPIVFYRREDGTPVALVDRCPHRFAPLSTGTLIGDAIQCGYHGLVFDCSGACVSNPHNGGKPLRAADIRSFHLFERYGFVWIWPGDPALADPALLPHYPYLEDDSRWKVQRGHLHVKGNYQLVTDNLLDLTHAPYLHPGFKMPNVTPEQQLAATTTRLDRFDDRLLAYRLRTGLPPNQATIDLFDFPAEPCETRTHMTWYPPALIDFDNGTKFPGQDDMEGFCFPQAHCMTPETETTCHYFFAAARNLKLDDPAIDAALLGVLNTAFRTQDEPMIEAVQARMGPTGDLDSLNPVLLKTDGPPVTARRMLKELIAAEQAAEAAATAIAAE
ncbi:Rieske 2Fe-2S domain-containing protein [Sphingomonas canadensis]|uniref:Rieske 2Fe-2S domain-containing protein n=1 Tax=Sphingomonas canadensis TaxID=1219257 RepID=A0ABW3HB01_9SPHN|nr:aromatic ring-hydroxylating dioxygenase subunit alpha [Sphingomonas canadensis]MCW3838293.1 aromatic ring-hydroxylating dioxygenase subunit alpha [Sphingomonas canadensis]